MESDGFSYFTVFSWALTRGFSKRAKSNLCDTKGIRALAPYWLQQLNDSPRMARGQLQNKKDFDKG